METDTTGNGAGCSKLIAVLQKLGFCGMISFKGTHMHFSPTASSPVIAEAAIAVTRSQPRNRYLQLCLGLTCIIFTKPQIQCGVQVPALSIFPY